MASRTSGRACAASRDKHGFDLLAWVLPFARDRVGAVALGGGRLVLVAQPSAGRPRRPLATTGPPLDPELERRVDEELARFDA